MIKQTRIADHSSRAYKIVIAEGGEVNTISHTLEDLLDISNEFEYRYSILEDMDLVLDLKKGQSMYFKPNRGNKCAKGIIVRIS